MSRDTASHKLPQPLETRTWSIILLSFVLIGLIYPRHDWRHHLNDNEASRIYLVQSIVDHHALNIDGGITQHGDVVDKAEFGGHYYCDKPPGLAMAAIPVYAVIKVLGGVLGHTWTYGELRYLLTLVCIALPTVAMAAWIRGYWLAICGSRLLADFSIIALVFGTIAFTYSTQFMGHQFAAVLAVAHFAISRRLSTSPYQRLFVLVGLLAGYGAISDYFSSFIHLIIAASYIGRLKKPANAVAWIVGGLAGVAPLLLYNAACFGSPFQMAYAHEATAAFQEVHSVGFLGVSFPSWESVFGLLFSASKGLFFLSPFLIFALTGAIDSFHKGPLRRELLVACGCVIAIIFLATSLHEWRAGWTVGPRHMASMLPFMMTLVVAGVARRPKLVPWYSALVIVGIGFAGLGTLTFPVFEPGFQNPVAEQAAFLLQRGMVSLNWGATVGLTGWASLLPILLILLGVLGFLLRRAILTDAKGSIFRIIGPAILAIGWLFAVLAYLPDTPARRTALQGRVLGLTDHLRVAATTMEHANELSPTSEIFELTVPHLQMIYQELGDTAALGRLETQLRQWQK